MNRRWSVFVNASYSDEMRTTAGQGPIRAAKSIEDRLTVDLSANLYLFDRYRVYLQLRNLLDETYVAARRPYGLRPGLPRTFLIGLDIDL